MWLIHQKNFLNKELIALIRLRGSRLNREQSIFPLRPDFQPEADLPLA